MRALERHYKVVELAELWGMSPKLIRKIFGSQPGVLKIDRPELLHKRGYCSLYIPESVVLSVHQSLSQSGTGE
jgi:hypothetical protein